MNRFIRRLYALFAGNFVVVESMPYSFYARYRKLGRFRNLDKAKRYADRMATELQGKVVVLAADSLSKMYVYRPRGMDASHITVPVQA